MLQHLESVIRARIPSITSLINKTIDELESEMDHLGRPIAVDAGVSTLKLCQLYMNINKFSGCSDRIFFRHNYTLYWNSAVHLTRSLRNTWMEGKVLETFFYQPDHDIPTLSELFLDFESFSASPFTHLLFLMMTLLSSNP